MRRSKKIDRLKRRIDAIKNRMWFSGFVYDTVPFALAVISPMYIISWSSSGLAGFVKFMAVAIVILFFTSRKANRDRRQYKAEIAKCRRKLEKLRADSA